MSIIDISDTLQAKSDQLNADDLIGGDVTITITDVSKADSADQPLIIKYDGFNGQPWKPCKSMRRVLAQGWGKYANEWIGKSLTIYRDPKVKWAGKEVGGIRISHMSDIKGKLVLALTERRGAKADCVILPLVGASTSKKNQKRDLIKEGEDFSKQGMEAYKTWFSSLSNEDKKTIQSYHEDWKKTAEGVDSNDDEIEWT